MNRPVVDPAHSAFAAFTDADTMRTQLGSVVRTLWDDAHRIVDCEVAHAWRKTYGKATSWHRSHLRVCYRLRLAGAGDREPFPAWVHGTAHLDDDIDREAMAFPATVAMGAATLRLRRFPDDPGLPQLARLVDPDHARARLRDLIGATPQDDVSVTVLRYRPAERCSLRVAAAGSAAFAKTYHGGAGGQAFRVLRHLFAEGRRDGRRFAVAEPLAYDADTSTVWQRWIDGGTAAGAVAAPDFTTRVRQCAQALAGLHAITLDDVATRDRTQLLHETRKRAVKLALAYPDASGSLQRTTDTLLRVIDDLPSRTPAVVHGDVHLDQFLLQRDDVAMADVDEIGLGDAEQDVAALLLDLRLRAAEADATDPWPDIAAEAYGRRATAPIVPALFAWHQARHCIDKAYRLHWRNASALEPVVIALVGWAAAASRELEGASS